MNNSETVSWATIAAACRRELEPEEAAAIEAEAFVQAAMGATLEIPAPRPPAAPSAIAPRRFQR